ncbi:MAG: protein translocase subunit SecDF, partial [Bacteroidetes bacterium]|nr:protein translocase subunit SecDF [Bacteroidota bacterium]
MRNKGVVVVLSIVVTLLCLYYLSFTFVSRRVRQDATQFATDANGTINLSKKQRYVDSLWNKPVYNLFGAEYTYKEVKENELSLGLDLQGGMHVVLEVSPADIIRGLSGNNQDPAFMKAMDRAREMQKTNKGNFADVFYEAFKEVNPDRSLASVFASAATRGRVSLSDSDDAVLKFLKTEIESAIDRSFTILKTRIDQFGTSQPNIQRLQDAGRIQIEIPGADNPQRVRKLLQGVARLEFWEVVEYNDPQLGAALRGINDMLLREKKAQQAAATSSESKTSGAKTTDKADTTKSALEQQLTNAAKDSTGGSPDSLTPLNLPPLYSIINPGYPFLYHVKDT